VSWQRIYHSVTVTSNHTWSLLCTVWFICCHFFSITFDCHLQNSTQFLTTNSNYLLCPFITPQHGARKKHSLLLRRLVNRSVPWQWTSHCCARMLPQECVIKSLPSNGSICHNILHLYCRYVHIILIHSSCNNNCQSGYFHAMTRDCYKKTKWPINTADFKHLAAIIEQMRTEMKSCQRGWRPV
jgi:hypothetical protein